MSRPDSVDRLVRKIYQQGWGAKFNMEHHVENGEGSFAYIARKEKQAVNYFRRAVLRLINKEKKKAAFTAYNKGYAEGKKAGEIPF